jgi:hypothetical protein
VAAAAVPAVAAFAFATLLAGCGLPQGVQDRLDQRQLRERFGIPRGAELLAYEGYPSMVGFGQREGLNIGAVYRLTDEQERVFTESSLRGDWRPLPMPLEHRGRMRGLAGDVPLDLEQGIYTASTAGSDVMRARDTVPISEVAQPADLILGVLDSETNQLHVRIASGY